MAYVVNTKLAYKDWLFLKSKLLSNAKSNTKDKALLFLRKHVFCLKNWKLLRALTTQ